MEYKLTDDERRRRLLTAAVEAALAAAAVVAEIYQDVLRNGVKVEYKSDRSPVTLADREAHAAITQRLTATPGEGLPVFSEEGAKVALEVRRRWHLYWLVDPLDGTKEFVQRRGEFTVNVALVEKTRARIGVVAVPMRGRLYFAAAGIGAYRADIGVNSGSIDLNAVLAAATPLPLPATPDRRGRSLVVVGSRSHGGERLRRFVEQLRHRFGSLSFAAAGSALKFGLVAEGTADIYPRLGPTMEWDTAAGQCLIEQSGGAVLRFFDGQPLDYNREQLRNPDFVCLSARFLHHFGPEVRKLPGVDWELPPSAGTAGEA